jgi:hypothetical protein
MRVRRIAAAVLAVPLVAALPAEAAKKKVCGAVLADPRGDAGPLGSGNLDLVSADLTEGGNELYLIMRVAAGDSWAGDRVGGSAWQFAGTRNGVKIEFGWVRPMAGAPSGSYVRIAGQYVGHAGGMAGDFMLWKVPRMGPLATKRAVWSGVTATTYASELTADTATGKNRAC